MKRWEIKSRLIFLFKSKKKENKMKNNIKLDLMTDEWQNEIRKYKQIQARIAALEGRELRFWNKIRKIQALSNHGRYCLKSWQIDLIAKVYNSNIYSINSFYEVIYDIFCYGFHQGIQYRKNKQHKKHSCQNCNSNKSKGTRMI